MKLVVDSIGCLVTGASSGIGRAVAVELGRRRCRVALVARRGDELAATARAVEAAGGRAAPFIADVRDTAALRAAVDAGVAWSGGLRLAVVNAGVGVHGALESLSPAELREAVEVNLLGMLGTAQAALPHLRATTPSSLVVVASLSAIIPYRGGAGYATGKAGLVAALRCLRLELAGSGVAVGWLCPGHVDTRIIADRIPFAKLPRLARLLVPVLSAERVARAAVRLAPRGGERIMPWQALPFAAFARWMPRLAERALLWSGAGEP